MKTHNFILNNCDTDSCLVSKPDGSYFSKEERESLLKELNSYFSENISFADDGYFETVCILKAKNYVMRDENGKLHIKGSALKSSKLELALSEFQREVIKHLLNDENSKIIDIYNKYIIETNNVKDISRWSSKKTLTERVINSDRTNEIKIREAIVGKSLQIGDKFRVYFNKEGNLKLQEEWNGDQDAIQLMKRVYSTLCIFKNVIDMSQFPKYHLKNKKVQEKLKELLKE